MKNDPRWKLFVLLHYSRFTSLFLSKVCLPQPLVNIKISILDSPVTHLIPIAMIYGVVIKYRSMHSTIGFDHHSHAQ